MDWTDRHCRYFLRSISPDAYLYTEMLTAAALIHGDADRLLAFNSEEHPVALQLGGSDPALMADAAKLGEQAGYDEININVGCPSDRVQSGAFGACLMAEPATVAQCLRAMLSAVDVPVTVKTRIGIDDQDSEVFFRRFVDEVAAAGCSTFVVHARKAILKGLSPKENRSVPPLDYARVYRLKEDRPELRIVINGGVRTLADCHEHLRHVDGVMIGRQAYQQPWFLAELQRELLGGRSNDLGRADIVRGMLPYIECQLAEGVKLKHITRHLLGLFSGQPGARAWRRYLSENAHRPEAGRDVLIQALDRLPEVA